MALHQQLTEDMKAAMKSGDKARLEVLRFVIANVNSALKEKTAKDPAATLSDEEVITLLQKEAKRRKESIEMFKQGNRTDLVLKEEADLAVIMSYLPAQMSREEIAKLVDDLKAQGNTEFAALMRAASAATKGRADGRLVAEVVKEKLS